MKYAVALVLLAKKETVVLGKIDSLPEVGRCYENGMEINVEKTMVIGNCRQSFPLKITTDRKQWENFEYFNYLGSLITNDARCAQKIKSRLQFNRKKTFNQQT
jgi:hypothetical protein